MLFDEPLEEAFQCAVYDLVAAVERERGPGAAERVAKWAGVKPSTLYAWRDGTSTPSKWQYVVRLCIRSSDEGFPQIPAFATSSRLRLAWFQQAATNGSLSDEAMDLLRIGGELADAEAAGNGEAAIQLAEDLHNLADAIHAEGSRKVGRKHASVNGL